MAISLSELTPDEVIGFNKRAVEEARRSDPKNKEDHRLRDKHGLISCLEAGVFYKDPKGIYNNLPIEKMGGLLLYRIAQGQYFENANKRTALYSTFFFLRNNGLQLRIDHGRVNDLLWGFAKDEHQPDLPAKYNEQDAISYVEENVFPISWDDV